MTRLLARAALATLLAVTACAAPSQPYLDEVQAGCSKGIQAACVQVPQFQAQVNAEHSQQAANVATGFLAVLGAAAMGAAAGYAATRPVYVAPAYSAPVVVCCFR
jgi:hypothetical protein